MKAVNMELAYGLSQDYIELIQGRSWMQTPEQRLLFAILERGARDYLGNQRAEREAAEEWFFTEQLEPEACEPFCFLWVCEHLGIDPEEFRARLMNSAALVSARQAEGRALGQSALASARSTDVLLESRAVAFAA